MQNDPVPWKAYKMAFEDQLSSGGTARECVLMAANAMRAVLVAALTPEPVSQRASVDIQFCGTCGGGGKVFGQPCATCHGTGRVEYPAPPSAPSAGSLNASQQLDADTREVVTEIWQRSHGRLTAADVTCAYWPVRRKIEAMRDELYELRELHAACAPALNDAKGQEADLRHRLHVAEQARDALRTALTQLRIDANRLCDRNQGGSYEDDCLLAIKNADKALAEARR